MNLTQSYLKGQGHSAHIDNNFLLLSWIWIIFTGLLTSIKGCQDFVQSVHIARPLFGTKRFTAKFDPDTIVNLNPKVCHDLDPCAISKVNVTVHT